LIASITSSIYLASPSTASIVSTSPTVTGASKQPICNNRPHHHRHPTLPLQAFEVPSFGPPLDAEAFKNRFLTNDPIPNFDINKVPSAGAEWTVNTPERVEQLRTYLRENTYPTNRIT
jgi:hypothetical protein